MEKHERSLGVERKRQKIEGESEVRTGKKGDTYPVYQFGVPIDFR
jgi:hypothetical protein